MLQKLAKMANEEKTHTTITQTQKAQ